MEQILIIHYPLSNNSVLSMKPSIHPLLWFLNKNKSVNVCYSGFAQVMENLESHGIYDFNFQAWKVMEF